MRKSYKDLTIYFTTFDWGKSIRMFTLFHHELVGKIEKFERKIYLMVRNYMFQKVLGKIKMILGFEKFDDTMILKH